MTGDHFSIENFGGRVGGGMGKLLVVVAAVVVSLFVAAPAMAGTTIDFNATFAEPLGGPVSSPFTCPTGDLCGSGQVVGVGHVSESILFGGGCGGTCDLRTITFADGSTLVLAETEGESACPGNSDCRPFNAHSYGNPFTIPLTDTLEGALSTGTFAGATGTLTGQVRVAGAVAIITLSGTITLEC
jgi:hypothetical protein